MSQFNDALWITKFGSEVTHKFQQTLAKCRDTVTVIPGVTGRTYDAPVFGLANAFDEQPRGSDIQFSNTEQARRVCVLTDCYAADFIHNPDEFYSNVNYRSEFMEALWAAINRKLDARVIDALNASAPAPLSVSNRYDRDALVAFQKEMLKADIDPGPDVVTLVSPGAVEDMLRDNIITSADYMDEKGLQNGLISRALGSRHIYHNYLPIPSANRRRIFRYHKKAVHLAMGKEPTARVDYVPMKRGYVVTVEFIAGAVVTWNNGVVCADIDD